jgi:hypothetical protein
MKLGQASTHPSMNDGCAGFDDDEDAVVVAVDEPVEGHHFDFGFPAALSFASNAFFFTAAAVGPT